MFRSTIACDSKIAANWMTGFQFDDLSLTLNTFVYLSHFSETFGSVKICPSSVSSKQLTRRSLPSSFNQWICHWLVLSLSFLSFLQTHIHSPSTLSHSQFPLSWSDWMLATDCKVRSGCSESGLMEVLIMDAQLSSLFSSSLLRESDHRTNHSYSQSEAQLSLITFTAFLCSMYCLAAATTTARHNTELCAQAREPNIPELSSGWWPHLWFTPLTVIAAC